MEEGHQLIGQAGNPEKKRPGKMWPWLSNRFGIPFWLVSEFTTHFGAYFSGEVGMFHWGCDLDFDPLAMLRVACWPTCPANIYFAW